MRPTLLVVLTLSTGCGRDAVGTATLSGALGHREVDSTSSRNGRPSARVDSVETSLTGLTLELVENSVGEGTGGLNEVGVVDSITPDPDGRFSFGELPALHPWPPVSGSYTLRLLQGDGAPVRYGTETGFWLPQGAALEVSLPVVTRLTLPLWNVEAPDWGGPTDTTITMDADLDRGRLVYLNTQRGLGFYDPASATVDVFYADTLMEGFLYEVKPFVIEPAGLTAILMLTNDAWRTVAFIDHDIFTDDAASELVNYDDASTVAALGNAVTVLDLSGSAINAADCEQPASPVYYELNTTSIETPTRWFVGRPGRTAVFDLETRTLLDAWCDDKTLAVHSSVGDFLVFVTQAGHLELTDTAGNELATVALGAERVWSVGDWPGKDQVVAIYSTPDTPDIARMAIVDRSGARVADDLASTVTGQDDRWKDPAYDWGNCDNPEFEPFDFMSIARDGIWFNESGTLMTVGFGDAFEWTGDQFVPRPPFFCGPLGGLPDVCTGNHFTDPVNGVSVFKPLEDDHLSCIAHLDGSDLSVPVTLDAPMPQFGWPTPIPSAGMAVVPTTAGATLIHYANPDAAREPALRDLTDEVVIP